MTDTRVRCSVCGREFDPTKERNLYDQGRHSYTCTFCLSGSAASGLPVRKPRSRTGTILRIVFGSLFVLAAFSAIDDGDSTWVTCLLIGAALFLWQFWPGIAGLFQKRRVQEANRRQAEVVRQREEEARARELSRKWECPHCGASTSGRACEYCGMPRED